MASIHLDRHEAQEAQRWTDELVALSTEEELLYWAAVGIFSQGWVLAELGQQAEGLARMREGIAAQQAMGNMLFISRYLAQMVEAYGQVGQAEEGLRLLTEAFAVMQKTDERFWEAELYRLKGTLTLQQFEVQGSKFKDAEAEAEECFWKAMEIARKQQAKSLELRAAISLARLWQQQGKKHEARNTLAAIYHWFTEGFDTKDLQEGKALLEELS